MKKVELWSLILNSKRVKKYSIHALLKALRYLYWVFLHRLGKKRLSSTPDLLFFQIWRVWGRWWLESELTKKMYYSHFMDDMPIQIFKNIPSLARVSTIFFLESDRCGEFNNIFCIRMIAKGLGRIILFFFYKTELELQIFYEYAVENGTMFRNRKCHAFQQFHYLGKFLGANSTQ